MFHQLDMFASEPAPVDILDMPALIEKVMQVSLRPRYTLIVLNLLAKAADPKGVAGPYILEKGEAVPVRDWLGRAMIPMAQRNYRRSAMRRQCLEELRAENRLPTDPAEADTVIASMMQDRLRESARCSVSRAVSDLVRAGLVRRHYQGYCVDHHNRGAQREAVYTLTTDVLAVLA